MGTPSDVLPQSVEYFRTYFAGSLGFIMYNIFVGILQSVGDSRHPLIYLIVSSCINVALDLLFIGGLGLGVGAAALATVISQFTSAILCMIHLLRTKEELGYFDRKRFRADEHQCIRENGDGRLRFICKNRGFCIPSGYMLYDGINDVCQPESRCKTV